MQKQVTWQQAIVISMSRDRAHHSFVYLNQKETEVDILRPFFDINPPPSYFQSNFSLFKIAEIKNFYLSLTVAPDGTREWELISYGK